MPPNDTDSEPSATPADGHDPAEWVDLYGDALYRFALARVNDVPTAEDLVQETFLAAIKGRDRFKGQSTRKILDITATNSWVMLYRARMRLRRCLEARWLSEKKKRF